jgi:uncharacterized membrane protein YhaH (DUF805 family)
MGQNPQQTGQNINVTVQVKRRRRLGFLGWVAVLFVIGLSLEHWYYAVIAGVVLVVVGTLAWYGKKMERAGR